MRITDAKSENVGWKQICQQEEASKGPADRRGL